MNTSDEKYVISHPDGETHFYPGSKEEKADKSTKIPLTEDDLLEKIKTFPLPLHPKSVEIVGFGGYSVALRFTFENGSSLVGVLRYQDTELPDNPSNEEMHADFADFTLGEESIICADPDGNRLTLKLVPEVKGATLKDISLLHLLSNKELLRQFADFAVQTVDLFKRKQILPDLVGHSQKGLSYFPFFTSNIMAEFGTNTLYLVDTDLLPNNIFAEVSKMRKIILLCRVFSVHVSGMLANMFASFLEKEAGNTLQMLEHHQEFTQGVKDVVEVLESHNVDYRVLGSVAIASYLDTAGCNYLLSAERKDGSRRDIDILVLNKSPEEIRGLEQLFAQKQQNNNHYPEVSFSSSELPTSDSPTVLQRLLPRLTSKFVRKSDTQELVRKHGDLEMILPESDLNPQEITYQGVTFKTVNPNVLLGFAITRNGIFKFKDMEKFELFFEHVAAEIPRRYLDFARQIRSHYRKEYRNFLIRQWLSIATRGIFDGSLSRYVNKDG